jgi:hypothetical protein
MEPQAKARVHKIRMVIGLSMLCRYKRRQNIGFPKGHHLLIYIFCQNRKRYYKFSLL